MGKKSSIVCLHIIAILDLLYLLIVRFAGFQLLELKVVVTVYVITIISAEIIARGLKKDKYWGWLAAIIFFALNTISLFIVVSIIGLIGLFKKETRAIYTRGRD